MIMGLLKSHIARRPVPLLPASIVEPLRVPDRMSVKLFIDNGSGADVGRDGVAEALWSGGC